MKQNKKQIPSWARTGHRKPITRRELLGHGIIPFAGMLMGPQFLQMILSSKASAETVDCLSSSSELAPFISLNLQGGAAMASNFVPMTKAGAPLKSYDRMGLGDGQVPIAKEFGNANFAGAGADGVLISKMLQGIREMADTDTLSKSSFVGVCVRSRDDSAENYFNIAGLVTKAGVQGSRLANLGSRPTTTGDSQRPVLISPPSPLIVRNFGDIANSLGYTAALGTQLNMDQKNKLAQLVSNLSATQSRKLASIKGGAQIQNLVQCAGVKNSSVIAEGSDAVNPTQNTGYSTVWNINPASSKNSQDFVFGAMVYNALLGFAGTASLEIGGYDYHDNTRSTGDARDLEAGRTIGRILQSAKVLNKPVFLHVVSDGAVSSAISNSRNSIWTSDRGTAGASYMILFHPNGRPEVSENQIGSFTDEQVVDDKFITGNDSALASQAVFANYLQFNKKMADFNKVIPRGGLDTSQLKAVVKVA